MDLQMHRNSRLTLLAIAGAFLLHGAARADWDGDKNAANACFDSVYADQQYQPVLRRLLNGAPSVAQLSDESIATEQEAQLVTSMSRRFIPCRQRMVDAMQHYHPYALSALQGYYFKSDLVYVQLIQRRLSYGNANHLLYEAYLEYSARWDQYAQARSEEERRAQSAAVEALSRQAHAAPPPPPGASRLNCRWIGPTLYCNAY